MSLYEKVFPKIKRKVNFHSLFRYVNGICPKQLKMRHSKVGFLKIRCRKFVVIKLERVLTSHPVNEHCSLMEWEILLVTCVKFPSKCNFIFARTCNADAILLLIDNNFFSIFARPCVLYMFVCMKEKVNLFHIFIFVPLVSMKLLFKKLINGDAQEMNSFFRTRESKRHRFTLYCYEK